MEIKEKEYKEKEIKKISVEDIKFIFAKTDDIIKKVNLKSIGSALSKINKILSDHVNFVNKFENVNLEIFSNVYVDFCKDLNVIGDWDSVKNNIEKFIKYRNIINILRQIPGEYGEIVNYFLLSIVGSDLYLCEIIIKNPNVKMPLLYNFINYYNGIELKDTLDNLISSNPSISLDDIKKYPIKWNYSELSINKNLKWSFILDTIKNPSYKKLNQDEKWRFLQLSDNPVIDIKIVKSFPQYKWDYKKLSQNSNITLKIIKENPQISWDYNYMLSSNPNIKLNDLLKENKDIDISVYSSNPNLTIKDLIKYKNIDFDTLEITINPGISIKDIIEHPEIEWNIKDIISNPNMTFKTLIQNKHIFDYEIKNILNNEYGYDKYAKHRIDVVFPKLWLFVYYLYRTFGVYTFQDDEEKTNGLELVNVIANKIYEMINKTVEDILTTRIINDEIRNYNYDTNLPEYDIHGIISYVIGVLSDEYPLQGGDIDKLIDNLSYAYEKLGGVKISIESDELDKKKCGEETENEFFTQQEFKDIKSTDLVSFEFKNKTYCIDRQSLIDFWDQEPDEYDKSQAYKWGSCENECEKYYKIPISITILITEEDHFRITRDLDINYWKLKYYKNVTIGRGSGYEGEYNQSNEDVYRVVPINVKYKRN